MKAFAVKGTSMTHPDSANPRGSPWPNLPANTSSPECPPEPISSPQPAERGAEVPRPLTPPAADDDRERDLYPFKFCTLREGDKDPTLNKRIKWLIDSDDNFIVYVDEDNYVEWNMNDNAMLGPDTGQYLNRVGRLEAVDTSYLAAGRIETYRRLIAEAVARLFQKNFVAAQAALDLAEQWITARNTEVARRWYLFGSGGAAVLSAVGVFVLVFWSDLLRIRFGLPVYNILVGTCVDGLGAWLSVIQRSRTTELDVAAGQALHYLEGAFRIIAGTLGAMLVALAIRAGLIVQVDRLPAIMVMCMVAGASERLVPSFIEQMEGRTDTRDRGSGRPETRAPGDELEKTSDTLGGRG